MSFTNYSPSPSFPGPPYTKALYSTGIQEKCLHQCSGKGTEQSIRRLRFSSLFYQLPGPQMGKPLSLVEPLFLPLNGRPVIHSSECMSICGLLLFYCSPSHLPFSVPVSVSLLCPSSEVHSKLRVYSKSTGRTK